MVLELGIERSSVTIEVNPGTFRHPPPKYWVGARTVVVPVRTINSGASIKTTPRYFVPYYAESLIVNSL